MAVARWGVLVRIDEWVFLHDMWKQSPTLTSTSSSWFKLVPVKFNVVVEFGNILRPLWIYIVPLKLEKCDLLKKYCSNSIKVNGSDGWYLILTWEFPCFLSDWTTWRWSSATSCWWWLSWSDRGKLVFLLMAVFGMFKNFYKISIKMLVNSKHKLIELP